MSTDLLRKRKDEIYMADKLVSFDNELGMLPVS
jgi:hypothetical protein